MRGYAGGWVWVVVVGVSKNATPGRVWAVLMVSGRLVIGEMENGTTIRPTR